MVGIVIVSHSQMLAEGVTETAHMMAQDVPMAAAGGMPDGTLGTSCRRIRDAIDAVYSDDGVAILVDMGSAVFSAETVIEMEENVRKIRIADCPLVEGAVTAAIAASTGSALDTVIHAAEEARSMEKVPS